MQACYKYGGECACPPHFAGWMRPGGGGGLWRALGLGAGGAFDFGGACSPQPLQGRGSHALYMFITPMAYFLIVNP